MAMAIVFVVMRSCLPTAVRSCAHAVKRGRSQRERIRARGCLPFARFMAEDAPMKLGRLAAITKVFLEEGLGFLTEQKPAPSPGDAQGKDAQPSNAELAKRLR